MLYITHHSTMHIHTLNTYIKYIYIHAYIHLFYIHRTIYQTTAINTIVLPEYNTYFHLEQTLIN